MDKSYDHSTIYEEVEKGEKVECIHEGCPGYLKKATEFKEPSNKSSKKSLDFNIINSGKSLLCRCSRSCRHKFVILKNNFYNKSVLIKL